MSAPKEQGRSQRRIRIDDLETLTPLTQKQRDTVSAYRKDKNLLLHGIS